MTEDYIPSPIKIEDFIDIETGTILSTGEINQEFCNAFVALVQKAKSLRAEYKVDEYQTKRDALEIEYKTAEHFNESCIVYRKNLAKWNDLRANSINEEHFVEQEKDLFVQWGIEMDALRIKYKEREYWNKWTALYTEYKSREYNVVQWPALRENLCVLMSQHNIKDKGYMDILFGTMFLHHRFY